MIRRCCVSALTTVVSGCGEALSSNHATRTPGLFAYSHQEIRRSLRAGGYSDQLVGTPDLAVRRSAGHDAMVFFTRPTGGSGVQAVVWSAGAAARAVAVESQTAHLDASFRPVVMSPG